MAWKEYFEGQLALKQEQIMKCMSKFGNTLKTNLYDVTDNDLEYYRKIVFLAISSIKEEFLIKFEINQLCEGFIEMLHFLNLNNTNLIVYIK